MLVKPDKPDSQGHIKLDMRVSPKLGEDLAAEINASVEATQSLFVTPMPDILIVTQKQFVSLQPYTEAMYYTTDRMYVVPNHTNGVLGVMEVQIDRDIDTVAEVEAVLQDVEDTEKLKRTENPTEPEA